MSRYFDTAIIGGGIVGSAVALRLAQQRRRPVIVLEAEHRLASHQTGHNSGVIHSGLYYKPGSLKARLCVAGRRQLIDFCERQGVPYEICGKIVVATEAGELPALSELERRGRANGLEGMRCLTPREVQEHEPHIAAIAGLWVPQTGIVDFRAMTRALVEQVRAHGGVVRTGAKVRAVRRAGGELVLETTSGAVRARNLVNCAGLQSDRVARLCGVHPRVRIVPFRGEYYTLRPRAMHLVRNLVYPVPDARFPFLGVHFTRMIHGGVEAGPNAVLALARHGYTRTSFSLPDAWDTLSYRGFWKLARRVWRTGLGEMHRSLSKRAFTMALQRLLPELQEQDLLPGGAGVRAQALDETGALVDDFHLIQSNRMVHVLNAPSPAATASLAISEYIAKVADTTFAP